MRIILYTGKGGVGKTSVSAATAVKAAALGYKTLVISTDPAHSLGDALDTSLGGAVHNLAENLWAQEVNVYRELDVHWKTVQDWLAGLMRWQGADDILAEELAILPGMEELLALLQIVAQYREGIYDLLIVDCAPTAETLRLLSFPDMARWYMKRLFPLERRVASAIGPFVRGMMGVPVPDSRVFDSVQELYNQLDQMRSILSDPQTSSIRLVVNPEKMVIKETQRTFTYMNLYGYQTDLIVCNRIIPETAEGSFLQRWRDIHQQYLKEIEETFSPVPVFRAPLMDHELVGVAELEVLGEQIFGDKDPTGVFYSGMVNEIQKVDGGYQMKVKLPFTSGEELSVVELGNEVVVQAGRHRRNIMLPLALATMTVEQARLEHDLLTLTFKPAA